MGFPDRARRHTDFGAAAAIRSPRRNRVICFDGFAGRNPSGLKGLTDRSTQAWLKSRLRESSILARPGAVQEPC